MVNIIMERKIINIRNETVKPTRAKTLFLFSINSPMMPKIIPAEEAKNESINAISNIITISSDDGIAVCPETYTEYAIAIIETISKITAATPMINDAMLNLECFFSSTSNPVCNLKV
jgi:hypothetical protein